jgi:hypothetical protein
MLPEGGFHHTSSFSTALQRSKSVHTHQPSRRWFTTANRIIIQSHATAKNKDTLYIIRLRSTTLHDDQVRALRI